MNNNFLPYQESSDIEDIGFNEECFGYYVNKDESFHYYPKPYKERNKFVVGAPLYQQAFKFFRDEYNLHPEIVPAAGPAGRYNIALHDWLYEDDGKGPRLLEFSYEGAELYCIREMIKMTKYGKN